MIRFPRTVSILSLSALCVLGAGCTPNPNLTSVAEPFTTDQTFVAIPPKNGFGELPAIHVPTSHATITLGKPLPSLPTVITVLRLKSGTPSGIELENLGAAISLPSGIIGNRPVTKELTIDWTNDQGLHWIHRAAERSLEFTRVDAPQQPLTVKELPANDAIIRIADDFLKTHGVGLNNYRVGLVDPDWNLWWGRANQAGRCMDATTVANLRAVASSVALAAIAPPSLPLIANTHCVSPEFPARVTVRYHSFADEQDILNNNGSSVNGIELVIDVSRNTVVAGRITLTADSDRSDYPALTQAQVQDALLRGGLSGSTGAISITGYDIALLRLPDGDDDTFLVPSLVAIGTRTLSDGTTEPFRIVVPLLARSS